MINRSKGSEVIQIIIAAIGFCGVFVTALLFSSNIKAIFIDDNAGGAIAAALLLLPLQLILSAWPAIFGLITFFVALKQRLKISGTDMKDNFSLVMMIIGIVLVVVPVLMDSSIFIIAKVLE